MPTMFALEPAVSAATLEPFDDEALRRELRAFAGPAMDARSVPRIVVASGTPATAILHHAAETRTDLVVLGTHGRTGFERLMLGSVTEKVVRRASCPVLTVPRGAGGPEQPLFGRILCGADFSEAAGRAVQYALSLAQEAKGHLTVLHVLEWMPDEWFARYPQVDLQQYR